MDLMALLRSASLVLLALFLLYIAVRLASAAWYKSKHEIDITKPKKETKNAEQEKERW